MLQARWRLTLAASALLVASSASGVEPSPAVRVVRIKAVADEAFREKKDWEKEIREHLAWSDEKLRELAGIGLDLVAVEPWRTHQSSAMTLLLNELRAGVEKDGAEAVIGFTGHPPPVTMMFLRSGSGPVRYPVPFAAGIAFPLGDRVVVRRTEWKKLTRHTLIHEVAHLFGGLHVNDKSILETETDRMTFRLDPFNRRVLDLTRDRSFDRGIREIPRDELTALADLYRQAPLRGESDPDTAIRIAYLYMLVGKVEDALEEFRRAAEIAPEQTRDILGYAIIPELEAWAEAHEPTVQTRYLLAQAYFIAERWQDASVLLGPSCSKPSEDALSCALLGAVYLKSGQLGLAERTLRTALQRDDSLAESYATLASVSAAAGRYDEALDLFGRALELDPGHVETHFNTGVAYLAADKPGAAEASFREVLRLRETRDDARAKLALALARQGQGKEARALVRPFKKRRFLSAFVLRDMAEVYFLSGDTKEAFRNLQLAKKGGIDVQEVEALIQQGDRRPREVEVGDLIEQAEAYYRTAKYDTARGLLERAAEEKPREPQVHYWFGRVANGEKDEERALAHFQRSLELDPDFLRSRYELGRFAYGDEDYAKVVSWLEPYVESGKGDSSAYFMLGRSQFQLGDLGEAEEHLRTAIRKRSDDGNFFYFLARVFLEQGRDEEARRELELALDSRSLPEWRREDAHLRLARLLDAAGEGEQAEDNVGVALRLGASETSSALVDSTHLSTDRIEIVRVAPSPARALARGKEVRIVSIARFDLRSADRGAVFLAPQDENGTTLVRPQPRAAVERGRGEVTLEATITTPASGSFVEVFLALHAEGDGTTTAVTRVRYALE
jgi:tetratricopeptide (TPR) repeat protein